MGADLTIGVIIQDRTPPPHACGMFALRVHETRVAAVFTRGDAGDHYCGAVQSAEVPSAVLFDLDGTLVDTEPYWMAAEAELVHRFGGEWSHEQGLKLVGWGLSNLALVLQRAGVDLEPTAIIDELTDMVMASLRVAVPWRPGAHELLQETRDAGLPTALVTMSVRRMAEAIAEAVSFPGFDVIVTADDVTSPKPDPEAYLRAAELLGIDITAAVAIEDSPAGLAAAVASGAVTIGVPHLVPLDSGHGWTIWPTLAGRSLGDVRALAATRAIGQPS